MSGTFWDFTLAAYGKPGVGPAVIALQDGRGADVNLLFYACWHDGRLDAEGFARADAAVAPWRSRVVEPLRAVRNAIRAGIPGAPEETANALRKTVLGAEIEGERIAQAMLEALPPGAQGGADRLAIAAANLGAYLTPRGARGPADRASIVKLLAACFPDAPAAAIGAAADRALPD